jgi:16S rRNA processing protein RimM
VARLGRTRGRSGELTGEIYSSRPERADELVQCRHVLLEKLGQRRRMEIERIWMHDGRPVFQFAGIDSISAAEAWEGADVLVSASRGLRTEAGEYTHAQLIGCRLERASDAGEVGIVRGVEDYGSAPLLKVETVDGREILVPFARSICKEVDVVRKIIRADLPEGLLEL